MGDVFFDLQKADGLSDELLLYLCFFHPLYHTAVRFVGIIPIIIDSYSQYFPRISFQYLRILPVFDLLYCCMSRPIIL